MEKYQRRHSGEFSGLLHLGIEAENIQEFDEKFTEFIHSLTDPGNPQARTADEIKSIIRNHAQASDKKSEGSDFSDGQYMHYFLMLRAKNADDVSSLESISGNLYEITGFLDSCRENPDSVYEKLKTLWEKTVEKAASNLKEEDKKDIQILLWKLISPILQGALQMNKGIIGDKNIFYTTFADGKDFSGRVKNKTRTSASNKFRKNVGGKLDRTPRIARMIKNTNRLSKEDKEKILEGIKTKDASLGGEHLSSLLARDAEILAFSENDHISEYFETIEQYLQYLENEVFDNSSKETPDFSRKYIDFLKNVYLKALRDYCNIMRKIKEKCPYLADLILEPYLLRIDLVDGIHEPTALHLFNDWQKAADIINRNFGYQGEKPFSFTATHQKIKKTNGRSSKERADKTILFVQTPESAGKQGSIDETTLGMPVFQAQEETNNATNETILGIPVIGNSQPDDQKKDQESGDDWSDIWKIKPKSDIDPFEDTLHHPSSTRNVENELEMLLSEESLNTVTRNDKISDFIHDLNDNERSLVFNLLHRKIKDGFEMIKYKIFEGQIDLIENEGHDVYQLITMLIYARYACTGEMKKHFSFELAAFYTALINSGILNDQAKKNLNIVVGTLFSIVQNDYRMDQEIFFSLEQNNIIQKGRSRRGSFPGYVSPEFPALNDFPDAANLISDEQKKEILDFQKETAEIIENLVNLQALYNLKGEICIDSPPQTYILLFKQIEEKFSSMKRKIEEYGSEIKGGWFNRTFRMRKRVKKDVNDYFVELNACIDYAWEEIICPAYLLFGNILLGEKVH